MTLFLALLLFSAASLVLLGRGPRAGLFLAILVLLSAVVSESLWRSPAPRPEGLPKITRGEHRGSGACQSCHPSAYASWHASFHRSMTREARELQWDGRHAPRLPVTLSDGERTFTVFQSESGGVQVRGPDLHAAHGEELVERELVMATGSHHYITFWLRGPPGRELRLFPFVFLLEERSWTPRREVFLAPPEAHPKALSWNSNCIQCHAVAGEPQQSEGTHPEPWVRYETRVAELGIACEACHGPGHAHIERHQSPWSRHLSRQVDPSDRELAILQPEKLDAEASSALCGQCHAYFIPAEPEEWWERGFTQRTRPELDYADARLLLRADDTALAEHARLSRELESIFWSDGTIRIGGREYNGLLESPCYQKGTGTGQLSCLSCHSMHAGDPNDQLHPDRTVSETCLSCHEALREKRVEHSGHRTDSSGSECVSCHMPKTTYALLQGIHSHRITSPSHRLTDPPSACALCHVDKSSGWIHENLDRLFPRLHTGSTTYDEEDTTPLAVRQLLSGNAAERALFASAFADRGATELVPRSWSSSLLMRLDQDPYPAVRRIAERSIAKLQTAPAPSRTSPPPQLDPESLDELRARRDDRPIVISE